MKIYKIKDTMAIFWFFIICILQYNKYYKTVLLLLFLGMIGDLVISVTNIGDSNIKNLIN
jgi:hypothetical protein